MAVIIPFSGDTPDAIPKAMAKGNATMPTMTPAIKSAIKVCRLYFLRAEKSFGLKSNVFIFCLIILEKQGAKVQKINKVTKKCHLIL